jgi:cytoskeletal protein RodZ
MEEEKKEEQKKDKKSSISLPKLPKVSLSLSPVTKWVLTIVILGIGLVVVVVLYTQQETKNSDLEKQVRTAETTLVNNSQSRTQLEQELLVASASLDEAKAVFPASDQSMEVEEALSAAANAAGVRVDMLNCLEPEAETVGETEYQVFQVSMSMTGDAEGLMRFVGTLGDWLPSAKVNSFGVASGEGGSTLSVSISVYAL